MNTNEFKQALSLAMSSVESHELLNIVQPDGYPNRCGIDANDRYTEQFCAAYWEALAPMSGCASKDFEPVFVTLQQVALNIRHHGTDAEQIAEMKRYSKKFSLIAPDSSQVTKDQAIVIVGELVNRFNLPVDVFSLDWTDAGIPEHQYAQ